jgi:hypothetical protein
MFVEGIWWNFIFAFPTFLILLFVLPEFLKSNFYRPLIAGLILCLMIFPHYYATPRLEGIQLSDLKSMFKLLQSSPPGSKVAGPPVFFMDFIPGYAKRPVHLSGLLAGWEGYCKREQVFWKKYYSSKRSEIINYLADNNIDFLLVDRRFFSRKIITGASRCNNEISAYRNDSPYLDQSFSSAIWNWRERLYLITPQIIKNH